jgi:hypothetical protein
MKYISTLLIIVLLFSACATTKPQVTNSYTRSSQPDWLINPPASTSSTLYGVGEGRTKQEALNNALSEIVSRLNVSIASKFSSKNVVKSFGKRETFTNEYVNETQSEVKKISLSGYEIIEQKSLGFKHYATLVKLNKNHLFETLKKSIENDLAAGSKISIESSPFDSLQIYKKALFRLGDIRNRIAVLNGLHPQYNTQQFLDRYEDIKRKYNLLKHSISFEILSDYSDFAKPLASALSKEGFSISRKRDKRHFFILIKSDINRAKSYGFDIARALIDIRVVDNHRVNIAQNVISLTGQSSQGFAIAKQDLVKKLQRKIQEEGVGKVLNLNI